MTVHVTAPMLAAYNHFLAAGLTKNGPAESIVVVQDRCQ